MVAQENCEEEASGSNHGFDIFGIFKGLCRFGLGSGQPTRFTTPGAPADPAQNMRHTAQNTMFRAQAQYQIKKARSEGRPAEVWHARDRPAGDRPASDPLTRPYPITGPGFNPWFKDPVTPDPVQQLQTARFT
ncbi:hypothetical protein FH972_025406 [Carpinus fangiana]|uniref:Uncharacterized protein n=1 Tax=Carpinus fangiana TaxID=176857 RepID=A0A5N6L0X4_9ROSI|nr:hypothetical protein FH972_025406 [Carpinus fangiana]